ncbi:hypothetical protein HMPREF9080_02324 [Cardiobacterium valvarum F0432]|uniref:Uncharacterized protein n=1 Tax=Cardiobacterium valvarum F0432 TaxID=797473 RepID=G9ZHR7_9GAMM|nr:hypothetical protein HMPREF9080_02324 [Cardiobacterium valvarum F0432]
MSGNVIVAPRILPDTTDTAPNSSRLRANDNTAPLTSAGESSGRITRQNTCQGRAPSVAAASST